MKPIWVHLNYLWVLLSLLTLNYCLRCVLTDLGQSKNSNHLDRGPCRPGRDIGVAYKVEEVCTKKNDSFWLFYGDLFDFEKRPEWQRNLNCEKGQFTYRTGFCLVSAELSCVYLDITKLASDYRGCLQLPKYIHVVGLSQILKQYGSFLMLF